MSKNEEEQQIEEPAESEELAEKSTFLEVSYLLMEGQLPTASQLEEFEALDADFDNRHHLCREYLSAMISLWTEDLSQHDGRRIALGLKQLAEDPWETRIPEKYTPGSTVRGKVTKITNFGVFVELEDELEGLLHVSELSDQKIEHPESMVNVGDEIEVRIL